MSLDISHGLSQIANFKKQLSVACIDELVNYKKEVSDNIKSDKSFKGNILRNSVKYLRTKYKLTSFTNVKHAIYIEEGTKSHVIQARNVRFLKFEQNGQTVYRRRVFHPGNKPYHFFKNAHNKAFLKFKLNLSRRLQDISRSF